MTQVASHRRRDISEQGWGLLELRRASRWGGIIMRTGAPWRDLPPDYGDQSNTHRRLARDKACCLYNTGADCKEANCLIDGPNTDFPEDDTESQNQSAFQKLDRGDLPQPSLSTLISISTSSPCQPTRTTSQYRPLK